MTESGDESSLAELTATLDQEHPDIPLLINNSGVIQPGKFRSVGPRALRAQILLDAAAPMTVPRACLHQMNRGATIINVGSVSGFAPVKNQVVYAASKSFLYEFSLGLR